jgi:hypothetical protein
VVSWAAAARGETEMEFVLEKEVKRKLASRYIARGGRLGTAQVPETLGNRGGRDPETG